MSRLINNVEMQGPLCPLPFPCFHKQKLTLVDQSLCVTRGHFAGFIIHEGLDGGGVWYSLFIKNLAHYSSH